MSPSGSWQFAMTQTSETRNGRQIGRLDDKQGIQLGIEPFDRRAACALFIRESAGKEFSDEMNVFLQQLKETGHARPVTPAYPQVTRAFQQAIDDISFFDQHQDIQSVLDTRAKNAISHR
ncbi:hypothetical protein PO124_26495 [Bacillus licheniformis]|nr:hypothetical protein [Bacillus licheniformis]